MKFITYTTKGLEFVSEREIKEKLSDAKILEVADKRIIFESSADFNQLIRLKTVDDLGILVSTLEKVADLDILLLETRKIDFKAVRNTLSEYREIPSDNFSITTSLARIKAFAASDIVTSVAKLVQREHQWNFTEFDHTNFDIRFFIDHTKGYISIRVTKESLQHRNYKTSSKEGSLKPTIAAAMVYLAKEEKTGLRLVDNFCGSGTILAEGLAAGLQVYGGDIDPESVLITQENLSNFNYAIMERIKPLTALSSGWPDKYFDFGVSNLPWGKQVEIKSITTLFEGSLNEYSRILKQDGIFCALISQPDLFIKYTKKYFPQKKIEQFKIGLLGQTPTIVLIK